jgi:hypothetical protein
MMSLLVWVGMKSGGDHIVGGRTAVKHFVLNGADWLGSLIE